MAQTRYSNVLPYLPNHNVNGISERMKEREKAHLARERNMDHDGKKVPSFPSPVRVEENDGISTSIKNVLGNYTNFKRFMILNKGPDNIIGVEPVPATPTEAKTYFGSDQVKGKDKDKKRIPDKKKETKGTEHKLNSDSSKYKAHKSNSAEHKAKERKFNDAVVVKRENKDHRDQKDQKDRHTDSNEVNKTSKTTDDTNDKCSSSPVTTKTSNETIIKGQNERTTTNGDNLNETTHQKPPFKIKRDLFHPSSQKIRPMPLHIPARDNDVASTAQNVHHNDMKVQSILKEMTEPVSQPPLTGICTPISKKGFPFTKDKDDVILSSLKSPLHDGLPNNDENKTDQEDAVEQEDDVRNNQCSRSRSSSSSCSSSSDDSGSSDSEGEGTSGQPKVLPKVSNLNAISPSVASGSFAVDKPKSNKIEHENGKGNNSIVPCSSDKELCNAEKNTENSVNSLNQNTSNMSTNDDNSVLDFRIKTSSKKDLSLNQKEDTEESAKTKTELNKQVKDDTAKMDTANLNKTDSSEFKGKHGTKLSVDNDTKQSLNSGLNRLNDERNVDATAKHKSECRTDKAKVDGGTKSFKTKSDNSLNGKVNKSKHKLKHRSSEKSEKILEKKVENSKKDTCSKIVNKELSGEQAHPLVDKYSDDAENSDVDVVTCESPAKKRKTEKLNGDNTHTEIPLGIEIIHDREKDPKSLVVKINLSLLKRQPKKVLGCSGISVVTTPTDDEKQTVQSDKSEPVKKVKDEDEDKEETGKGNLQILSNKRSSTFEKEHQSKRVRHDSDHDKITPCVDQHRSQKTIMEQNLEVDEEIRKSSPDTHLQQAKTLKREADKLADIDAKTLTYINAIIRFICCGRSLEDKEENRAAQMYSETEDLLKFVLKRVLTKTSGQSEDKRLTVLCLRIQSLLLHKLYRLKSKQTFRNSQLLADHFKASHKSNIASPYTTTKHGSTPSPMSPTPSPAGSIGSVGSSSSDGNNGSSQNGRPAPQASSVTSPVSISIPQRVHTVMSQYVSTTSKLLYSIDIWDKADNLAANNKDFFSSMDSLGGALTFHSSIAHVVYYARKTLSKLQDHGKDT